MDLDFIRAIIQRLKHNEAASSDEELRRAFESYTLLTLDLAMTLDEGQTPSPMIHETERVSDLLLSRVRRF